VVALGASACDSRDDDVAAVTSDTGGRAVIEFHTDRDEANAGTMPDVVCMDLQTAIDTLQEATEAYPVFSRGPTGHEIIMGDWVVIAQAPTRGTPLGADGWQRFHVAEDGESTCD
jgi:hypothetical protein